MIDLILGLGSQIIWPILMAIAALLGVWGWGQKKKAEGKAAERERAQKARELAARQARETRDKAAAEPISKQREDLTKWEQ